MSAPAVADEATIRKAAEWFMRDGGIAEVRAVDQNKRWHSGYFDNPEALTQAVMKDGNNWAGTYINLNKINPDLLARRKNRIAAAGTGESTGDKDVVARKHLLIDIDPVRPSGISSTDAEHKAAEQMARSIHAYLTAAGWPAPAVFDSGNGDHLISAIDEPADDGGLVERCLKALHAMFSTKEAVVDTSVFNASRSGKLAGTLVGKGDSTADRPHRLSRILSLPEDMQPVPHDLLEALASNVPVKEDSRGQYKGGGQDFDMRMFLADAGIAVRHEMPWNGGTLFRFETCPACNESSGKAAAMMWPGGERSAKCFRDSCALNADRWEWMKAAYPDAYRKQMPQRERTPGPRLTGPVSPEWDGDGVMDDEPRQYRWYTGAEIAAATPEKPDYLVPPYFICGVVHDLTAKIKGGKTTLMLDLVRALLENGEFLGQHVQHPGPVVLLTEQPNASFQDQLKRAGIDSPDLHVLYRHETRGDRWDVVIPAAVQKAREAGAVLMAVDTLSGWAGFAVDAENDAGATTIAMRPLTDAAASGITVLVNRHGRKSPGEIGDTGRGSSAIGGSADVLLHLAKATSEGHENRRSLECTGRFDAPAKMMVDWDGERYLMIGESGAVERDLAREAIIQVLPSGNADPMLTPDLREAVKKHTDTTIGKTTFDRALADLVDRGVVDRFDNLGPRHQTHGYLLRDGDVDSINSPLRDIGVGSALTHASDISVENTPLPTDSINFPPPRTPGKMINPRLETPDVGDVDPDAGVSNQLPTPPSLREKVITNSSDGDDETLPWVTADDGREEMIL